MPADTIPARLLSMAKKRPDAPAYYVRAAGTWQPTSWAAYGEEVRRAARALITLGLPTGGTVCILGFNRPEWVIADLAAMMAGGAAAGIYTTCSPEEVQYIIAHAEAPIVVLEDAGQWEKVRQQRANLPLLKHVVMMKGAPRIDDPMVLSWEDFVARADATPDEGLDQRLAAIKDEDLATLIYTSGTTGPPKAVMLSHKNLAWTAGVAREIVAVREDDCSLSYLPLSHIAEQMFSIHVPTTCGTSIYYAESMEKLPENLKEVQPTIFFGVPRVWEKFHAGIKAKLKDSTGMKAKIGAWAMGVGRSYHSIKNAGATPGSWISLQYKIANKLVFSKVKPAIGMGRARFCVSGAAPIAPEVLEFMSSLDIVIFEVYGQSEDTGPTSFNAPGKTKFGSVGPAIPGVEVKIAADGEICVRGPNVFMGYYKEPAATGETLIDGWLHSGDLGKFDDGAFLHITGRKKEIIITAGGKNIAPKNIEAEIKTQCPMVSEAVVIGDRRRFLSALLVLDDDRVKAFAAEKGITGADLKYHPDVTAEVQRGIDRANEKFAKVEWIRKWKALPRPLTIADGELTPTLKIKRKKVEEHFRAVLDEIYAEDVAA